MTPETKKEADDEAPHNEHLLDFDSEIYGAEPLYETDDFEQNLLEMLNLEAFGEACNTVADVDLGRLEVRMDMPDNEDDGYRCSFPNADDVVSQGDCFVPPFSDSSSDNIDVKTEPLSPPLPDTPPFTPPVTDEEPVASGSKRRKSRSSSQSSDDSMKSRPIKIEKLDEIAPPLPVVHGKVPIPKNGTTWSVPPQPLVFTSANVAQFITSPVANVVTVGVPHPTPTVSKFPKLPPRTQLKEEVELANFRKQQRKIKNRESACLSRQKKREYVMNLESTKEALEKEVSFLREENAQLKMKVQRLESASVPNIEAIIQENAQLKAKLEDYSLKPSRPTSPSIFLSSPAKSLAIFSVFLLVAFNVALPNVNVLRTGQQQNVTTDLQKNVHIPFLSVPSDNRWPNSLMDPGEGHRRGRSLLWATESNSSAESISSREEKTKHPMCPMYINQTESLRLDNELRGLFRARDEVSRMKKADRMKAEKSLAAASSLARVDSRLKERPSLQYDDIVRTVQNEMASGLSPKFHSYLHSRHHDTASQELQVYASSPPPDADSSPYAAFFEAIDRRDDTFYVVSFTGDHLLLPASRTTNNVTRPRMALVMPVVPVNETMKPPKSHVAMVQIECDVTGTRLVHVNRKMMPADIARSLRTRKTKHDIQYPGRH